MVEVSKGWLLCKEEVIVIFNGIATCYLINDNLCIAKCDNQSKKSKKVDEHSNTTILDWYMYKNEIVTFTDVWVSEPGASFCLKRPACTQKDYYEVQDVCDSNKKVTSHSFMSIMKRVMYYTVH